MEPIITSVLTSFATTLATNGSKVPMQTLDDLWYMAFNKINFAADKKRAENEFSLIAYKNSLANKIYNIPDGKMTDPNMSIVGPALEVSPYYIEEENLREMFANLIATSLNADTANDAHPSFVEIIKQLNSDEARILAYIKGNHFPTIHVISQHNGSHSPIMENFSDIAYKAQCKLPNKIHSYLDNLSRLGLIQLNKEGSLSNYSLYSDLEKHPIIKDSIMLADTIGNSNVIHSHAQSTMFGVSFYKSCIKS